MRALKYAEGCFMAVVATAAIAMPANATATQVYECVVAGQRTFSDQRCGDDAQARIIADSNRMAATPVRADSQAPKARNHAGQAHNDESDKKKATCNGIRDQQAAVQSQQRSGYSARQGEKLRERHDKLMARYAALRCERYR